jgi:hypothetical protein
MHVGWEDAAGRKMADKMAAKAAIADTLTAPLLAMFLDIYWWEWK